jgi:hypothetical protein
MSSTAVMISGRNRHGWAALTAVPLIATTGSACAGPNRQAQQETIRPHAAEAAAHAEVERVRADAERMLAEFRAEATHERDEMRADLRARAERGEREADAYRDELAHLREPTAHDSQPGHAVAH